MPLVLGGERSRSAGSASTPAPWVTPAGRISGALRLYLTCSSTPSRWPCPPPDLAVLGAARQEQRATLPQHPLLALHRFWRPSDQRRPGLGRVKFSLNPDQSHTVLVNAQPSSGGA